MRSVFVVVATVPPPAQLSGGFPPSWVKITLPLTPTRSWLTPLESTTLATFVVGLYVHGEALASAGTAPIATPASAAPRATRRMDLMGFIEEVLSWWVAVRDAAARRVHRGRNLPPPPSRAWNKDPPGASGVWQWSSPAAIANSTWRRERWTTCAAVARASSACSARPGSARRRCSVRSPSGRPRNGCWCSTAGRSSTSARSRSASRWTCSTTHVADARPAAARGARAGSRRGAAGRGRARRAGPSPAPTSASATTARCGAMLELLGRERPLALLLDDLHWADDASLELVLHLLRRPPRVPHLLVFAARPDGAVGRAAGRRPQRARLRRARARAARGRRCARRCWRTCATRRCAGAWRARRRGNPLFLRELARAAAGRARPLPATLLAAVGAELARASRARAHAARGRRRRRRSVRRRARGGGRRPGLRRGQRSTRLVAADLVRPAATGRDVRVPPPAGAPRRLRRRAARWRLAAHERAAAALERHVCAAGRARLSRRALRAPGRRGCDRAARRGRRSRRRDRARERRALVRRRPALLPHDDRARRAELAAPRALALVTSGRLAGGPRGAGRGARAARARTDRAAARAGDRLRPGGGAARRSRAKPGAGCSRHSSTPRRAAGPPSPSSWRPTHDAQRARRPARVGGARGARRRRGSAARRRRRRAAALAASLTAGADADAAAGWLDCAVARLGGARRRGAGRPRPRAASRRARAAAPAALRRARSRRSTARCRSHSDRTRARSWCTCARARDRAVAAARPRRRARGGRGRRGGRPPQRRPPPAADRAVAADDGAPPPRRGRCRRARRARSSPRWRARTRAARSIHNAACNVATIHVDRDPERAIREMLAAAGPDARAHRLLLGLLAAARAGPRGDRRRPARGRRALGRRRRDARLRARPAGQRRRAPHAPAPRSCSRAATRARRPRWPSGRPRRPMRVPAPMDAADARLLARPRARRRGRDRAAKRRAPARGRRRRRAAARCGCATPPQRELRRLGTRVSAEGRRAAPRRAHRARARVAELVAARPLQQAGRGRAVPQREDGPEHAHARLRQARRPLAHAADARALARLSAWVAPVGIPSAPDPSPGHDHTRHRGPRRRMRWWERLMEPIAASRPGATRAGPTGGSRCWCSTFTAEGRDADPPPGPALEVAPSWSWLGPTLTG